jgi:hypothetical protein
MSSLVQSRPSSKNNSQNSELRTIYKSTLNLSQFLWQETGWSLNPVTKTDEGELKSLFWKLHAFNTALDPRFALSAKWEKCFEEHFEEVLQGQAAICFVTRDKKSGKPAGFILAAVHTDSKE